MSATERTLPRKNNTGGDTLESRVAVSEEDDNSPEDMVPVMVLEEAASFEEMAVWGHEAVPEPDDPYVKGVEEWIAFAGAVSRGRSGVSGWADGTV